jgi:hypothetical protein
VVGQGVRIVPEYIVNTNNGIVRKIWPSDINPVEVGIGFKGALGSVI